MKSDLKYLIHNSSLTFILRILGMGLGYLIAIYISKFYGAEVFGRYSILVTFSQFSIMIFSLGIPIAVVKLTSETQHYNKTPVSDYLVRAAVVLLFSGLVGSLLIYTTSNLFGYTIFHDSQLPEALKYLSYFFVFLIFHNFGTQFLSGTKNFLAYSLSLFIFPNILFFVFLFLFRSLQLISEFYVLLSYLLSLSIVGLSLLFVVPLQKVSKEYPFRNLIKLSFPILLSSAFLSISSWTDIFMLGTMATKAEVGIYSAAYKLATITLLVILTVNIIIAPKIAELYHLNNMKQLKSEVRNANRLMTYLTVPIIIVLLLFRKFLLGWFGIAFLSGELVLILMSLGFLVNAFCGTVTHILNMTNYQKILRNLTLAMAILNISLNFLLIPKFGINGAAAASLISQVFLNATAVYYVKKHLGFWALL